MSRKKRFDFGSVSISLNVENGTIVAVDFAGDYFGELDITEIEKLLVGCKYSSSDIGAFFSKNDISRYIHGAKADEIAELLL